MAKDKKPKTQMISFPAEFKPLLDKELDERGFFTYCELMGQILAEHYGKNKVKPPTKTTFKEVKKSE